MSSHVVHLGDCLDVMRGMDDDSIDAVVCDPPYGLSAPPDVAAVLRAWLDGEQYEHGQGGFMGCTWDSFVPGPRYWREACRVLKPGGHLIAFAGTRTVDLMGIAIRLGGFEYRDTLHWTYNSGFPKSLDVSKSIDGLHGAEREVVGVRKGQGNIPNDRGEWGLRPNMPVSITTPSTPDAIRWDGFGTAVKPAVEPAILARKPLRESSIARQVLATGTGALNINGCRFGYGDPAWVGPQDGYGRSAAGSDGLTASHKWIHAERKAAEYAHDLGRFPANLYACEKAPRTERERGCAGLPERTGFDINGRKPENVGHLSPGAGTGRTSSSIRNFHPTVKPVRILRWLCRLVTPPGGTVADFFAGSGSCGVAAVLEGFDYIGVEKEPDYHRIAEARIAHAIRYPDAWEDTAPGLTSEQRQAKRGGTSRDELERNGQTAMFGGSE